MLPECPVCSGDDAVLSFSKDDYQHFHCRDCDALYLFPLPTEAQLSDYYVAQEEETRSSQCWEREEQDYRHYETIWDDALHTIERGAGRGPLLDVGCGGGQFLAYAKQRGWEEVEGIEMAEFDAIEPPGRKFERYETEDGEEFFVEVGTEESVWDLPAGGEVI